MSTKFKNVPFGTEVPEITKSDAGNNIIALKDFTVDFTGATVCGLTTYRGPTWTGSSTFFTDDAVGFRGCGFVVCCGGCITVNDGGSIYVDGGDILLRCGGAFRNDYGTTFIGAKGDAGTIVRSSSFAVGEIGCAYMFCLANSRADFAVPVTMNNPMLTCSTFYLIAHLSCGCTFYADCGSTFYVDCGSSFCVNCGSSFCGDLTGSITFGCGHSVGGASHSVDFYYPPVFHCGSSLFCCGTIGFASEDNTRSCFLAVYGDGSSITQDGFGDPSSAVAAFSMSSGDGLVIESRYGGMQLKSSCGSLLITVGSTTLELDENALKTLKTNIGA